MTVYEMAKKYYPKLWAEEYNKFVKGGDMDG